MIVTDSDYVKNNSFYLKGNVPEGPRIYHLQFENGRVCRLAIDNGEKISINSDQIGDINDFKHSLSGQCVKY